MGEPQRPHGASLRSDVRSRGVIQVLRRSRAVSAMVFAGDASRTLSTTIATESFTVPTASSILPSRPSLSPSECWSLDLAPDRVPVFQPCSRSFVGPLSKIRAAPAAPTLAGIALPAARRSRERALDAHGREDRSVTFTDALTGLTRW
jgi:hypothetical protein